MGQQRRLSWFGLVLIAHLSLAVNLSSHHLPRPYMGCGSFVLAANSAPPLLEELTAHLLRHRDDRRISHVVGVADRPSLSSGLPCGGRHISFALGADSSDEADG